MHDLESASKWKNEVIALPFGANIALLLRIEKPFRTKLGGQTYFVGNSSFYQEQPKCTFNLEQLM